ncbi:ABC1-domain-containing protein [Wallemia mellicola]|nr:ABC1-domain-containing protein [Wallemia mellicola]
MHRVLFGQPRQALRSLRWYNRTTVQQFSVQSALRQQASSKRWSHSSSNHSDYEYREKQSASSKSVYFLSKLPPSVILLLIFLPGTIILYNTNDTFKHTTLAGQRCARCAQAFVANVTDYKITLARNYANDDDKWDSLSRCHKRCAERVLAVLKSNGGVFIKLGQHISSVALLPLEWTGTMRPLQDQCNPSSIDDVNRILKVATGKSADELFASFEPNPIGVASLAQVHIAHDKSTGQKVAVKVQHPGLDEYAEIDIRTVQLISKGIKKLFPEFEFTWLADEMAVNLPLELDFRHESNNARRCKEDFAGKTKTSLYIPEFLWSHKLALCMEYIEGARPDDLNFLKEHNIDRNQVAKELASMFSEMVYINGFFHADPHPGNLLIRPAQEKSRSPYNFEVCLLDHGLYFDLSDDLRVNYARFWLSLMKPPSEATFKERRHYAKLVGNIDEDMYAIFESAITGKAGLEGAYEHELKGGPRKHKRSGGILDNTPAGNSSDVERLRSALVTKEGLITSVFGLLRSLPRRLLMVLKLNDLTRHLDTSLHTTHGSTRVFLIIGQYCEKSNHRATLQEISRRWTENGVSINLFWSYLKEYLRHFRSSITFSTLAGLQDLKSALVIWSTWSYALYARGFEGASKVAAGIEEQEKSKNTEEEKLEK